SRALRGVVPRAALDVEHAVERVRPICEDVRNRGVEALLDLTERFDGVRPAGIRVPAEALARALETLDGDVRAGREESIRRGRPVPVRAFAPRARGSRGRRRAGGPPTRGRRPVARAPPGLAMATGRASRPPSTCLLGLPAGASITP